MYKESFMNHTIPRVKNASVAQSTQATTGTGRLYIDDLHRFYIAMQSQYLSPDLINIIAAVEPNWFWVYAPKYEKTMAFRPLPRESNDIDILWPIDKQIIAGIKMTADTTLKLDGLAEQGIYHYLVIEADDTNDYTLSFESGFFMDRLGNDLTSYTVVANKGVVIPFIAIFNSLLQVPLHI
jgi:hypothetical protein